jgi:DNA-binding NarL/FixJ family response regulator
MNPRFLLVDDHAIFRAGLRAMIQSRYADAELAEAGDAAAAVKLAEDLKPDLIVMDIHLPDQNGLETSRQILAHSPSAKIIILSAEPDLSYVKDALKTGVLAYLLKTDAPEELPAAMEAVLAGKLYLCPAANEAVLQDYRHVITAAPAAHPQLSARELEVLRAIADGLRAKDIAARLQVGVKTVETYRRRLMKKLALDSTAELVRYALREGIIPP